MVIIHPFTSLSQDGAPRERVSCPDTTPKRETSEFLVVLSQHVWKTGNPITLLDLLQSCDMKQNRNADALRNVDRNTALPTLHCERVEDGVRTQIPVVTNVDHVAVREFIVKAV